MLGHPKERIQPQTKYVSVYSFSAWLTNGAEPNMSKILSKFGKNDVECKHCYFSFIMS